MKEKHLVQPKCFLLAHLKFILKKVIVPFIELNWMLTNLVRFLQEHRFLMNRIRGSISKGKKIFRKM